MAARERATGRTAPEAARLRARELILSTSRFVREGEYWTLAFGGIVIRLRDNKGLRHLAQLLREPGTRIPARDLFLMINGSPSTQSPSASADGAPDSERCRLAVTKSIKAALEKIEAHHPSLGYHLRTTIKTGAECAYLSGPGVRIEWEL